MTRAEPPQILISFKPQQTHLLDCLVVAVAQPGGLQTVSVFRLALSMFVSYKLLPWSIDIPYLLIFLRSALSVISLPAGLTSHFQSVRLT
jgi:hypothetical protein